MMLKSIKSSHCELFLTDKDKNSWYKSCGDIMKVKLFDFEDESDLEKAVNSFLDDNKEVVDIKYSVSSCVFSEEQIFCFSAMIIYY